MLSGMSESDPKAELHRYLQAGRDALLWKLDGLSEYDVRRPMVPTGTNLLGLVKHVASVEAGYFGGTFGRPFGEPLPWFERTPSPTPTCGPPPTRHATRSSACTTGSGPTPTRRSMPSPLDAIGHVPWWDAERDEVTLHRILVHMISETNRHAGHADIVRELIDGTAGLRVGNDNMVAGRRRVVAALPPTARAGSRARSAVT